MSGGDLRDGSMVRGPNSSMMGHNLNGKTNTLIPRLFSVLVFITATKAKLDRRVRQSLDSSAIGHRYYLMTFLAFGLSGSYKSVYT